MFLKEKVLCRGRKNRLCFVQNVATCFSFTSYTLDSDFVFTTSQCSAIQNTKIFYFLLYKCKLIPFLHIIKYVVCLKRVI